jgi:hypothetical protein
MKLIFTLYIFLFLTSYTFSQDYTIRGFLYEKETGEVVLFEKVQLLSADSLNIAGSTTDVNGFFNIPRVEKGTYILKVDNGNYTPFFQNIKIETNTGISNVRFELEKAEKTKDLSEVTISAEAKAKKTEIQISVIKLDKKSIERIPSMGAENDIIGAFSVTPGVVTTGDQGGQMYVRGGTPIQNKVLLDGMTIYNPFHSIGFFSIFETELIKNVDIHTGGFDAKYGGRISSVMDVTYRDGNKKEFGGKLSVSPFLAKAVLEGPFKKKNDGSPSSGSYILSAKHCLLNFTDTIYPGVNNGRGLPFNFTDLYGKVSFNSDEGSKFSAFGFHNRDSVNFYNAADLDFKASGGGINFLIVPNSSTTFIRGHVNGSNYITTFNEAGSPERTSSIGGFDLGFDFTHFLKHESQVDYGFNLGGFNTKFLTYNELNRKIELDIFTSDIGGYTSAKIIRNRIVFQPSFRLQYYASLATISPEPRIGVKYNATEKFRLKFSGGRFSQNFTSASSDKDVVNLFNGLLSAPINVQQTFNNENNSEKSIRNGLQYAWHAIFGFEYDITKHISTNVEGYYKYFSQLSNINPNKLYEDNAENTDIADEYKKDFIIESGKSYGVDVLLKYSNKRVFLWAVYSYGKSNRWDGFESYAPVFDRRHNINLVSTYSFGKEKDGEISVRWNLGSGLPFTPTSGFYQNDDFSSGVTTDYTTSNPSTVSSKLGDFNSQRLPSYHRLDITIKKQFKFKNKTVLEVIGSITNAYNRKNIFYVNRVTSEKIYQFPILPSMGVSYKF